MRHKCLDEDQRAALRRLRRAQLTEAQRIRSVVADSYLLTPAHLRSPCRIATLTEARQVAMYLIRTRVLWPTPTHNRAFPCVRIGRLLGGRDHTTIMHGVVVIAARLVSARQEDAALRQMVRAIGAALDATDQDPAHAGQRAA